MEHKTLNIAIKACKMVIACLLLLATAALDSTAKPHYLLLNSHPSITLKTYSLKRKDTPSFTLEDKNGKKVRLSELKGKVVFINFWAPWCAPCREEMPGLDKLYSHFKGDKNIEFITVDLDHNFKKSLAFMSKSRFMLPVYVAVTEIPADFIGEAIPTTVILDRSGKIVFRQEGGVDYYNEHFIKYLEHLFFSKK
jgi:thiol-disulfide isomerase/thioredoxin